jgi:4-diphosphocytidyl-2-C-methyl-D-erythritol kinase
MTDSRTPAARQADSSTRGRGTSSPPAAKERILRLRVSAKINLHLSVLAQRPDHYHEILSLLQSISLYDYLQFHPSSRLVVECAHPGVPRGRYNLAYRAAEIFFRRTGIPPEVAIHIDKHIPVGAGLGGGSADAAATLVGLNRLFAAGVPTPLLAEWAGELGTDVPFFLRGGTALARGRGDRINCLPPLREGWFVLVYPGIHISTSWAYSLIQPALTPIPLDDRVLGDRIRRSGLEALLPVLHNAFEPVATGRFSVLQEVKDSLHAMGAEGALMSGTGSTVFGLVRDAWTGRRLCQQLNRLGQTFLTHPVTSSIEDVPAQDSQAAR